VPLAKGSWEKAETRSHCPSSPRAHTEVSTNVPSFLIVCDLRTTVPIHSILTLGIFRIVGDGTVSRVRGLVDNWFGYG
jgi:hypothetical protein